MRNFVWATIAVALIFGSCKSNKQALNGVDLVSQVPVGPSFVADSAFAYCEAQCEFGPRTMNSKAHDDCEKWIVNKFKQFGCEVTVQKADLNGYDGTVLHSTNIIAANKPEQTERVMLCAHWDSRPWADNDPDSANWHKPVMAADDGASGVAVMLEIARLLQQADSLKVGIDFICFDAEDWGVPQWDTSTYNSESWALGAQYWSDNLHKAGYKARYGILLDMVGGQGAHFYQEGMSKQYAQNIVDKVWAAAKVIGFGSYFHKKKKKKITDDHIPVNEKARIQCIDIIPFYPNCEQSNFGPTWHTVNDDMQHIDKNTLQAVGQTVIQVLFSEK